MNIEKLKTAEGQFLQLYPMGFEDPALQERVKHHRKANLTEKCQEAFTELAFNKPHVIVENMAKMVNEYRAETVSRTMSGVAIHCSVGHDIIRLEVSGTQN